jgi:hypothetical protein
LTDEEIIGGIALYLRRPSDRETERRRYTVHLIRTVCTWLTPSEIDQQRASIPLFGGPPDGHYHRGTERLDGEDSPGVFIEGLGCDVCLYIYNPLTDDELIYDDRKGEKLIAKARKGDRDADAVLCIIAAKHATAARCRRILGCTLVRF